MYKRNPQTMVVLIFTIVFFYLLYKVKVNYTIGNLVSFILFSAGYALVIRSAYIKVKKSFQYKDNTLDKRKILDEYTKEQIRIAREKKENSKKISH
jgi:hypothetical protein